jgi:hypothetical protein
MAVPDHPGAAIRQLQLSRRLQKRLQFDFDRLGEQVTGSISQDFCQWIVNRRRLTEGQDVGSLVHGGSLSSRGSGRLDTRLDTPPISFRHHPVSRIAPAKLSISLS